MIHLQYKDEDFAYYGSISLGGREIVIIFPLYKPSTAAELLAKHEQVLTLLVSQYESLVQQAVQLNQPHGDLPELHIILIQEDGTFDLQFGTSARQDTLWCEVMYEKSGIAFHFKRYPPLAAEDHQVDRLYFPCDLRINGVNTFVVWYEDDRDGFVRRPDGQLLHALSLEELTSAASEMGLSLVPHKPVRYDLDQLREWCVGAEAAAVDCPAFLNAWNLFDDLAQLHDRCDSDYGKLSRGAAETYDKLFWGNNLPSVTPPGKQFTPAWSAEELEEIRRVMEAGLRLVEAELPPMPGPPRTMRCA